jgi:hypothetical protein
MLWRMLFCWMWEVGSFLVSLYEINVLVGLDRPSAWPTCQDGQGSLCKSTTCAAYACKTWC